MDNNHGLLKKIHNAFDPFDPLPAKDPQYVDCRAVRGDGEIIRELGKEILLADRKTYQLYTGHRGAGKSTELLRLAAYLRENNFRVIYFAADEEDIDAEDTEYTDILLACARHLLQELKAQQDNPVWRWLQTRVDSIAGLLQSEIVLEDISVDAQIVQFAKLTATLKASPDTRAKLRDQLEPHTVSLLEAINQFINEAMAQLSEQDTDKLVLIADNLDRMVEIRKSTDIENGYKSNYERIFLDRSTQLKSFNCHVIYTVPISLVYSSRGTDLRDIYDADPQVLPMIMANTIDGQIYKPGLDVLKEIIDKRVFLAIDKMKLQLESDIFDSTETLNRLCLMSGGHVRNLMQLVQSSAKYSDHLPIDIGSVKRAITKAREIYKRSIYEKQWKLLAEVAYTKRIKNESDYRSLLFNRCILEYQYVDEAGELQCWYDVHPLIRGIPEFQDSFNAFKEQSEHEN